MTGVVPQTGEESVDMNASSSPVHVPNTFAA
jgi:hypothetical protein